MKGEWSLYLFSTFKFKKISCAIRMLYDTNCGVPSKCAILYVYKAVVKAYHLNFQPKGNATKYRQTFRKQLAKITHIVSEHTIERELTGSKKDNHC